MIDLRTIGLTLLTMIAFAGNSILCRLALRETSIDAATFTAVRLISGAAFLFLIVGLRKTPRTTGQDWPSAIALFVYAAAFSFAYIALTAGTGALLLFGAVQLTMIATGIRNGESIRPVQIAGLGLAMAGLIYLLSPGITAPPVTSALLMLAAGVAWGVYSLRGNRSPDPIRMTTKNFAAATPFAVLLFALCVPWVKIDTVGVLLGMASGMLASALGYVLWYTVLPSLRAIRAASVQLSVPVLAAFGGVIFLNEAITLRLAIASAVIFTGISLVIMTRHRWPR